MKLKNWREGLFFSILLKIGQQFTTWSTYNKIQRSEFSNRFPPAAPTSASINTIQDWHSPSRVCEQTPSPPSEETILTDQGVTPNTHRPPYYSLTDGQKPRLRWQIDSTHRFKSSNQPFFFSSGHLFLTFVQVFKIGMEMIIPHKKRHRSQCVRVKHSLLPFIRWL